MILSVSSNVREIIVSEISVYHRDVMDGILDRYKVVPVISGRVMTLSNDSNISLDLVEEVYEEYIKRVYPGSNDVGRLLDVMASTLQNIRKFALGSVFAYGFNEIIESVKTHHLLLPRESVFKDLCYLMSVGSSARDTYDPIELIVEGVKKSGVKGLVRFARIVVSWDDFRKYLEECCGL